MSTDYSIYTKISIEQIEQDKCLEIEKADENAYRVKDKYDNYMWLYTDENGIPVGITRYRWNNPTYILCILVKTYDLEIIDEYEIQKAYYELRKKGNSNLYDHDAKKKRRSYTKSLINLAESIDWDEYKNG